jgi:hypothetical protein
MKKYQGIVVGKELLLGGVKKHRSIWFNDRESAKSWVYAIVEGNLLAKRDIANIHILESE